jgi:hypothetical protein
VESAEPAAALAQRVRQCRPAGEAAVSALLAEAARAGIAMLRPAWDAASFALQRDPFSGEDSLVASFVVDARRGSVCLRPDGSLYAEFDICEPHPSRPGLWIEAVVTWGRPPQLKSEARLLAMPEEA